MNGVLALVLGGLAAGCSKDDVEYIPLAIQKAQAYDKLFKETYGEIDPKQNWGFEAEAEEDTPAEPENDQPKAATRGIASGYNFKGDASDDKFLSSVPAEVRRVNDPRWPSQTSSLTGQTGYIDNSFWASIEVKASFSRRSTLYIQGNCDFSWRSFSASNSDIYLVQGSTLTLNAADIQPGCNYYIAPGASLIVNGKMTINTANVYNRGTVQANGLALDTDYRYGNTYGLFYNRGTANIRGDITINTGRADLVNAGTLTADNLTVSGKSNGITNRGGGNFLNDAGATTNISGATWIKYDLAVWVNEASYKTGHFYLEDNSKYIINNCNLTVDGDFCINNVNNSDTNDRTLQPFKIDAGAYVECNNFYGGGTKNRTYGTGPFLVQMGENALFYVKNAARMSSNVQISGIYGPASGNRAIFYAKRIDNGTDWYAVTYGRKLSVIATDGHFGQNWNNTRIGYADGFTANDIYAYGFNTAPKPALQPSYCGFTTQTEHSYSYDRKLIETGRVFCEDLGNATREDLDFNDVVFDAQIWRVDKIETTTSFVNGIQTGSTSRVVETTYENEVKLLAAGGTYEVSIDGIEVHNAFGVGHTTMVNTRDNNSDAFGSYVSKEPVTLTPRNTYQRIIDIPVVVNYDGDYGQQVKELTSMPGQPPHKILIPLGQDADAPRWVTERKNISLPYKDFKRYVNSRSVKFWRGETDSYYLYDRMRGLGNDPKGTVTTTPISSETTTEETLWSKGAVFEDWTISTVTLNSATFDQGDRIRFHGTPGTGSDEPYISVVYSDNSQPYFLDSKFPSTGIIEVKLDKRAATKLSTRTLSVRGRNFTLSGITIIRK